MSRTATDTDTPAALGGVPVFEKRIPMVRPVLPAPSTLQADVERILASGMVTKGDWLRHFEEAVAQHLGVRHAVAVSSCTSGLMLTYQALGLTGDAVVPSFTFMATVSSLVWARLNPVFADIDPSSMTLDVDAAERAITPRTSAIVAVHNFGRPADIESLQTLASRRGLKLIFDAAHGFGALFKGRPVGPEGDAQVYSLSPTKLLVAGEGGIVATNNAALAERIRIGREYGNDGNYDSLFAGLNARMPEFNALLGLRSLEQLELAAANRNRYAARLREGLAEIPGIGFQSVRPGDRSSYKDFAITVDQASFGLNRDALATALLSEGVDSRKYYDPPVHEHAAYKHFSAGNGGLERTKSLAGNCLSLPIWSSMEEETIERIILAVTRIHRSAPRILKRASIRA